MINNHEDGLKIGISLSLQVPDSLI